MSPSPATVDAGTPSLHDQVLSACMDFGARACQDSTACCTQAYGAYDAAACSKFFRDQICSPAADAVAAGFATYDASGVDACLAAHAEANTACIVDWDRNLELRKSIWAACKVVEGSAVPGSGCTTSVTCADPEGPKTVTCLAGACTVIEILPLGAACPFQNGEVSTCDRGLYCTTTQDQPGVCAPVSAPGTACSGVLGDPSCGFGNYCDAGDKTCKKTVNLGGPSCKQGLECVSFDCDRTTEICAPAPAVVSIDQCLGAVAPM